MSSPTVLLPVPGSATLIIEPDPPENPAGDLLTAPATTEEHPETGRIVAMGLPHSTLRVGMQVIFPRWQGTRVTTGGRPQVLLSAGEVLAFLEPES